MCFRRQRCFRLIFPSFFAILICLILSFTVSFASADTPESSDTKIFLHEGWALQSSCLFLARGEQISEPGYKANGWARKDKAAVDLYVGDHSALAPADVPPRLPA